jgi:spore maturation protein CgeB
MKALYIGQAEIGSTSRMRFNILCELMRSEMSLINTSELILTSGKVSRSIGWRYFIGPMIWNINAHIKKVVYQNQQTYDLIWVDKGVFIYPNVLREMKKRTDLLIHYTPDTAFHENNSRFFRKGMDIYDYLITTKSFEMLEYKQRVKEDKIIYLTQGYNAKIHYPRVDFKEKSDSITFIGLCEPHREQVLTKLIQDGFHIILGGYGWGTFLKKNQDFNSSIDFIGESILNEQYAHAISKSKFALGLLSKKFPEFHTTRTFEIPACGTCLITEENEEINQLFDDNECLKFTDFDELLKKLKFYMSESRELEQVTNAGYKRVIKENRNYKEQMTFILHQLNKSF